MALYFAGTDVALHASPVDANGVTFTPTTITCTVTSPTGNPVTVPAPAVTSPGVYSTVVPGPTAAGLYTVRWVAASSSVNFVFEDEFTIRPQSVLQIVDLASVKTQLAMSNDSTQDMELEGFIAAASEMIRDITGPIFAETHTQYFTGGMATISLDWLPLQSITSITEYYGLSAFPITEQPLGTQTNAFGYTVDYSTGQITRRTFGGAPALWALGYKNVKVVYVAGFASIPFAVRLAALRLIQHWWGQFKQQRVRGGMRGGLDGDTMTPMGFAMPDAVIEMLAPWRRPPGIA